MAGASQLFLDSFVAEDPHRALEELTRALEQKSNDAEYYSQRAYAHILLQNYDDAAKDAKKSLELQPNSAIAFLRKGMAEYHLKDYTAAHQTFSEGQKFDNADSTFSIWIKKCDENLNRQQIEVTTPQQTLTSKVKYDWYQTESQVIITVMIKNLQKNDVNIHFTEKELSALIRLPSGEDYRLNLLLLHPIATEQSTFKVLSTKIEIKLKKQEAIRWEKLEGHEDLNLKHFAQDLSKIDYMTFTPEEVDGMLLAYDATKSDQNFCTKERHSTKDSTHLYPSSSHYTRNWDKLVVEIKEEEKTEKLEGDAALNQLFQQIYADGTDEVKRAMNKSFMESGGTVLSTNWSDVGKKKVEVKPPDDMEWKQY
ncbi:protein SGT1 homolog isoform X2 [Rhinatrema bivittatum]|uniref:protein SGT1 homolog isoform X2 n=1 Tax=Rhinatrema bivittatum TaxID=194408 RepID=UPI00112EE720|nr:protein SGT1 homolog isoform X2 [Rhinatrema bivittatum]